MRVTFKKTLEIDIQSERERIISLSLGSDKTEVILEFLSLFENFSWNEALEWVNLNMDIEDVISVINPEIAALLVQWGNGQISVQKGELI